MRFSSSFIAIVAYVLSTGMSGEAVPVSVKDLKGQLEPRNPTVMSVADFKKFVKKNPIRATPVFYTGANKVKGDQRHSSRGAAYMKDKQIYVGPGGGMIIADVLKQAHIDPMKALQVWEINSWSDASEAFAHYAQPTSKKAVVVCGTTLPKQSVWHDQEWPALKANKHIEGIFAYRMHDDTETFTLLGDYKGREEDPCPPA